MRPVVRKSIKRIPAEFWQLFGLSAFACAQPLFDGTLGKSRWEKSFSLADIQIDAETKIEIVSNINHPDKPPEPKGVRVNKIVLSGRNNSSH